MIGSDKETNMLKDSRLMKVAEFDSMVKSLERFKHGLAVRAITGKKNIRHQKSQDQIFYSILEKMLLEVAISLGDKSVSTAEQQLLALKKVYLWFQGNKHVLVKSDGYFKSAQKITEEIYEKKNRSFSIQSKRNHNRKNTSLAETQLKTIESFLKELYELKEKMKYKNTAKNAQFILSPSAKYKLTSIDNSLFKKNQSFINDFDFSLAQFDDKYQQNRTCKLKRPMTAPPKIKQNKEMENAESSNETNSISLNPSSKQPRTRSAIERVQHELSWAKISPTPSLSKLIHKNEVKQRRGSSLKTELHVTLPTQQIFPSIKKTNDQKNVITDPNRVANLLMFKQFCYEHATQQEAFMQQYVQHKHGTRQHYLEFPEKKTEVVVKETAQVLQSQGPKLNTNLQDTICDMKAYRTMSLKEFLDQEPAEIKNSKNNQEKYFEANANRSMSAPTKAKNRSFTIEPQVSHFPSHSKLVKIVQPSINQVTVSSVYGLADGTGKQMHDVNQQALPSPNHGWRYPMVPVSFTKEPGYDKREASGTVLALQEGDVIQQKVVVPYQSLNTNTLDLNIENPTENMFNQTLTTNETSLRSNRPASSYSAISNPVTGLPSQCSTRLTPRHITDVQTVYRHFKTRDLHDIKATDSSHPSLRSAGTTRGASRPRTAASWGSYPAYSEVSPSLGAASHHTSGTLMHRSVAESMRVRSVIKKKNDINSRGSSSASSYVAQLRAKKRTGGNISLQTKPVLKKKVEFDLQATSNHPITQPPQLSFINIVAPMPADQEKGALTYIPPGGVYCGTTAAVAITVDKLVPKCIDDDLSDSPLSYEDVESATNKLNKGGEDKNEQNWLKDWLSGGALDGLGLDTNKEEGTTYADLISRAAILDSSGDRSYSNDPPSLNGHVGLEDTFPKDEIDLSPRNDPLLFHRTTLSESENESTNELEKKSNSTTQSHSNSISSQSSNNLLKSVSCEKEVGFEEDNYHDNKSDIAVEKSQNGNNSENELENNIPVNENESQIESENTYEDSSDEDTDFVDYTDDGETNSEYDNDDEFVPKSLIPDEDEKLDENVNVSNDKSYIAESTDNKKEVEFTDDKGVNIEGPIIQKLDAEAINTSFQFITEAPLLKKEDVIISNNINQDIDSKLTLNNNNNILNDKNDKLEKGDEGQQINLAETSVINKTQENVQEKENYTNGTKKPFNEEQALIIADNLPLIVDQQTGSVVIMNKDRNENIFKIKTSNFSSTETEDIKKSTLEDHSLSTDNSKKGDLKNHIEFTHVVDKTTLNDDKNNNNFVNLCQPNDDCDIISENNSKMSSPRYSDNEDSSPSEFLSFSSDSEREYAIKKCGIKIVVTLATKVEKELNNKSSPDEMEKYYFEKNRTETFQFSTDKSTELDDTIKGCEEQITSQPSGISVRELPEQQNVDWTVNKVKNDAKKVIGCGTQNITFTEKSFEDSKFPVENSQITDKVNNNNDADLSGMITFEEVLAVKALSRPVSGRPIPCEAQVKDPLVDMVANTRQKQVERNVDVHSIFAASEKKEHRTSTEKEKIAVKMLQRAYRNHLVRVKAARKFTGIKKETLKWAKDYKDKLKEKGEMRKNQAQNVKIFEKRNLQEEKSHINKIGPHTFIYENFHPDPVLPDKELIHKSAIEIQKCVRGWLIRQQLKKIREKCEKLGADLSTTVINYREVLTRTQDRHGKLKPSLTFTFHEFFHYLSHLSKFKALFKKREFWNEVEESELLAYFNDCNLFPSQDQINEAVEAVKKSMHRPKIKKKKHSESAMSLEDVLEVAFYIYPPIGSHL